MTVDLQKIELFLTEGLQMNGLDKESVMAFIGEHLTPIEYSKVEYFLNWLIKENRTFGTANFQEVWAEWESNN